MFEIRSKFNYEGRVCFVIIKENGLDEPVTLRSLYKVENLQAMCDANYKIYDYHGRIERPDGIFIMDLLEDDPPIIADWQVLLDEEEAAMSEAEATEYFTREVAAQGVGFAESSEEIKTRGDLIEYLNKYRSISNAGFSTGDVRPLNSFVARDALFTMEEIITDSTARQYMDIIERRRLIGSYHEYQKLIAFLQKEGKLGQKFEAEDVRRAYMAWGICGIKTKVTSIQYTAGVLPDLLSLRCSEGDTTANSSRVSEWCLVDREGVVHGNDKSVNLMDYDDYSMAPITPIEPDGYDTLMRSVHSWSYDYQLLKCLVTKDKHRTNYILLGDDGAVYRGRFEHDQFIIVNAREAVLVGSFLRIRGCDGVIYTIEDAESSERFRLHCLAAAKVRDIVRSRTLVPPVSSSFELCLREGVSPANAINYAAIEVSDSGKENDFIGADQLYCDGPSDSVVSKYNPRGYEYENIDELIDIFCATRDEMIESGEYMPYNTDDICVDYELANRPVEKLEFARDVKEGRTSVGSFGQGLIVDSEMDNRMYIKLLLLLLDVQYGKDYPIENKINALNDIEFSNLVNLNSIFMEKHAAYNGFLRDRAELNAKRANQCAAAVYVTKVFREISNQPLDKQRHYLFVCMYLDLFNKKANPAVFAQRNIAECICQAVDTSDMVESDIKRYLKIEAPSIALGVMFRLAAKQSVVSRTSDGRYVVPVVHVIEDVGIYKFDISISSADYDIATDTSNYVMDKICTLYDWCAEEVTGSAWNLYALNANITPWHVIPKIGVTIPVYNFEVNYVYDSTLQSFSEGFREKLAANKARVACLGKIYSSRYLLGSTPDIGGISTEYTAENVDMLLNNIVTESVKEYDSRFKLHNKAAAEKGMYLKAMRLKSDVAYENVADSVGVVPLTEDIYEKITDDGGNKVWLTSIDVEKISGGKTAAGITAAVNMVEEFNEGEQTYEELLSRSQIVFGSFVPKAICRVIGTRMLYVMENGSNTVELSNLTKDQADAFVSDGIFYQLGAREYLISTGYKKYKLSIA